MKMIYKIYICLMYFNDKIYHFVIKIIYEGLDSVTISYPVKKKIILNREDIIIQQMISDI